MGPDARRRSAATAGSWPAPTASPPPAAASSARDGIGQVEDVGTLPAARERGLGRAVTLAAARASAADGNELTYLGALADDWPRLMYAKLGFDEVGESSSSAAPAGLASPA